MNLIELPYRHQKLDQMSKNLLDFSLFLDQDLLHHGLDYKKSQLFEN